MRLVPTPCGKDAAAKVGIIDKAHRGLLIVIRVVTPKHHAVVGELDLFGVIGKMLEYDVTTGRLKLHSVVIALPNRDPRRIVTTPGPYIGPRIILCEPLRQIESISIHLIFLEPMLHDPAAKIAGHHTLVVKIVENIKGMTRRFVEPRIVGSRAVARAVPIQCRQRITAGRMIEHHIEDNGNAAAMTGVNEFFQRIFGTVIFIGCKIIRGIIAPAFVAIELTHRHQFNGIDAQPLQIT